MKVSAWLLVALFLGVEAPNIAMAQGTSERDCSHILCAEGYEPVSDPYGCDYTCRPIAGRPCGPSVCGPGEVCCNESCGICTPPGGSCIEIYCTAGKPQSPTDAFAALWKGQEGLVPSVQPRPSAKRSSPKSKASPRTRSKESRRR